MVRINDKILSGVLGEVIISHRYGKPYLRRKPQKVHNPRTPLQVNQRNKFKSATRFVSMNLDSLIRPYWNPEGRRQGMSGQNLFCRLNTHAFDSDGKLDLRIFKISTGTLGGLEDINIENKISEQFHITWKNNARDHKTSGQNQLKVFGLDEEFIVKEIPCNALRKDMEYFLEIDIKIYNHLFLFFWNPHNKIASDSYGVKME